MVSRSSDRHGSADTLVAQIVSTIAEKEGVDMTDLTPPLYEAVDVSLLSSFLEATDGSARVTFEYRDWEVEVTSDKQVSVTPIPTAK